MKKRFLAVAAAAIAVPALMATGASAAPTSHASARPTAEGYCLDLSRLHLQRLPVPLPLRDWEAVGGFRGTLECDIIHAEVTLALQRKVKLKGREIWEGVSGDSINLAGKKTGFIFNLGARTECQGTRYWWRLKISGGKGEAKGGLVIEPKTLEWPHSYGRELNCKTRPGNVVQQLLGG